MDTLEGEYAEYLGTIKEWQNLQMEKVQASKEKLQASKEKLQDTLDRSFRELERSLQMQRKRVALLAAQAYG